METATTEQVVYAGPAPDPMMPAQRPIPFEFVVSPPVCPVCGVWLTRVSVNQTGDMLFECHNGTLETMGHYIAVFRVNTQLWEQRPGAEVPDWSPPGRKAPDAKTIEAGKAAAAAQGKRFVMPKKTRKQPVAKHVEPVHRGRKKVQEPPPKSKRRRK